MNIPAPSLPHVRTPCGRDMRFEREESMNRWVAMHKRTCKICKDLPAIAQVEAAHYVDGVKWDVPKRIAERVAKKNENSRLIA